MIRLLLAAIVLTCVTGVAHAQTCTTAVCQPVVQKAVAVAHYAAPLVAPVQYAPAYLLQYDDQRQRQEIDSLRLQSAKIEQRHQDTQAVLIQLLMELRSTKQSIDSTPAPLKIQPATDGGVCLPEEIPNLATTVLSAYCARCHTAGTAKGGLTMFAAPGVLAPMTMPQRDRVLNVIRGGLMPPESENHPVSPGGLKLVEAYFRQR